MKLLIVGTVALLLAIRSSSAVLDAGPRFAMKAGEFSRASFGSGGSRPCGEVGRELGQPSGAAVGREIPEGVAEQIVG
jgi:hypothetical protein